jgi:hypothetical protein
MFFDGVYMFPLSCGFQKKYFPAIQNGIRRLV